MVGGRSSQLQTNVWHAVYAEGAPNCRLFRDGVEVIVPLDGAARRARPSVALMGLLSLVFCGVDAFVPQAGVEMSILPLASSLKSVRTAPRSSC